MTENRESNIEILNYIITKTKENIQKLERQLQLYHGVKEGIAMSKGISRLLADLRKDLRIKMKLEKEAEKQKDAEFKQQREAA